ncbi:hypothetical protein [Streptomyces cylindrosporus]|uniref:Uncharacterized protein n=1 Tax=Streptomyces cylindrosporus TaxID=2927583 RepID=A0ABS9YL49_9ACTN|nr:hypothetical protein [Streptomyces cylindrosporus]MCI3277986.1 hypothetical protein [Streptomyces cylindrosporus]
MLRRWFDEVARYGRLKFGAADGSPKPGLDPEDVLLRLSERMSRIAPDRHGEERAVRILALVVDGLRD